MGEELGSQGDAEDSHAHIHSNQNHKTGELETHASQELSF